MKTKDEREFYFSVIGKYIDTGEIDHEITANKELLIDFVCFVQIIVVPETANKMIIAIIKLIY